MCFHGYYITHFSFLVMNLLFANIHHLLFLCSFFEIFYLFSAIILELFCYYLAIIIFVLQQFWDVSEMTSYECPYL